MLAMLALLTLTLLGPAMTMENGTDGGGSPLRQAGYLLIALVGLISAKPFRHPERLLAVPWPLVAALAWCWVSVSWALFPDIAIRRIILTSIIVWLTFLLVRNLGYDRVLLLVRVALMAALVAGFAAVLLYPDFGIQSGDDPALAGDWRGIMMHKNTAGLASALTILFFLFDRQRLQPVIQYGAVGLAVVFLFFSGSRTAMVACGIAIPLGFLTQYYVIPARIAAERIARTGRVRVIALALAGILLVAGALFGGNALTELLSDPTRFTGRTLIWRALVQSFLDNPLLGAGYGSYWNVGPAGPIYRHANFSWVDGVSQGHNGYLDLLVQIGLPGLLLVLFAVVMSPIRRLLRTHDVAPAAAALIVAVILFAIVHNFSESTMFDRDTIGQVFLMVVLAMTYAGRQSPSSPGEKPISATHAPRRKQPLRL